MQCPHDGSIIQHTALAVGYRGPARWVALYVSSDHVISTNGAGSASGDTSLFLAYKRHPAVAPHLAGAHLDSADEEAGDWLLIDQAQQLLYLAEREQARCFLAAQWPRDDTPPVETHAELVRLLRGEHALAELPDWFERLMETQRERHVNARLMHRWLDQHGAAHA